jgi:SWI/SNF-related matrix-associated actin-dependent regulator of chromatin subfamily A-like protein 1
MLDKVVAAIENLRAPVAQGEYDLHTQVREALAFAGLECRHEVIIAPRCRIDFLCGGIGVEIKRGKPSESILRAQLVRYAASGLLTAIVLIVERTASVPTELSGIPVRLISLNKLWGVTASGHEAVLSRSPAAQLLHVNEEMPAADFSGDASLPSYLADPQTTGHIYGVLSYNRKRKCWTIKGEPCVTELAKRLFPGSEYGRRGEARFTAHRRIVGEVNWLMMRYPLAIAPVDEARWREALDEARVYASERARQISSPQRMQPPAGSFNGVLRPFQQAGLAWLAGSPRALLADEMGLGKTIQALCCLASLAAFPALVIVPPHLVLNWKSEIARFLNIAGKPPRVHIIKGLTPSPLPDADIYLMHYLLLRGWKKILPSIPFKAVIFDEIQELRHSGTEKYSAASLLAESCHRVIGLSGTPIYNQGGEIWNVVNILDYHFLGDWESFSREWCNGYGNAVVIKPDLLGEHLRREGLMFRRTKKEVLPELPEKRRLVQEIDADDTVYRKLMQPVLEKLRLWQTDGSLTPSARALLEDQISQEERRATGMAKATYVCQFVRALLEAGEKVLLFSHHHTVVDLYRDDLKAFRPAFVTGRESARQKEENIDRFMSGATGLCCVSLRAASGLNLQRATCVVFGELDWSPAVHSQAEDRAHRMGQEDSLLCYYLVSPRGSDADIQDALGLKVSQFLGLMGETPQSSAEAAVSAGVARRHVERLISHMEV